MKGIVLWWIMLKLRWGPTKTRSNAAVQLGEMRNPRAVWPLVYALTSDAAIRSEAATALGRIGDRRAADAVMHALLDTRSRTRTSAAWALGRLGDPRAVEPLAALLASDGEPGVCEAAAESLITLGDARGITQGTPLLVVRMRRNTQGGIVNHERLGEMLVPIGPRAVQPLIELLRSNDPDVEKVAVMALAQLGDARAVGPLITMLQYGTQSARRVSAEALAKLSGARATEALADTDPQVRQTCANLLARSGPRAVEPLIATLSADDPLPRWEAARVLATLRDVRAVEPLIGATDDPVDAGTMGSGQRPDDHWRPAGAATAHPPADAWRRRAARIRAGAARDAAPLDPPPARRDPAGPDVPHVRRRNPAER